MTLNDFQYIASRTLNPEIKGYDIIRNACYGLCGESGECIDILKKHEFQGHTLDKEKLIDEASDVLWYLAELATGLGIGLNEIAEHNEKKLRARYPDGFDAEKSIHRKEYE